MMHIRTSLLTLGAFTALSLLLLPQADTQIRDSSGLMMSQSSETPAQTVPQNPGGNPGDSNNDGKGGNPGDSNNGASPNVNGNAPQTPVQTP